LCLLIFLQLDDPHETAQHSHEPNLSALVEAAKAAARARMRDTVRSCARSSPRCSDDDVRSCCVTVFCHSCDRHFCDAFVLLPLTDVQEGMTYLQRHVPEDVEELHQHAGLVAAECLERVRDDVVWPRADQQR